MMIGEMVTTLVLNLDGLRCCGGLFSHSSLGLVRASRSGISGDHRCANKTRSMTDMHV